MTENATVPNGSYWPAPAAVVLGLGLALAAGFISSQFMMAPSQASAAQLNSVTAGTAVEVEVKVTAVTSAEAFDARLLEQQDSAYRLKGTTLHFGFPATTTMMMGQRSDVRPGAILSIDAVTDDPGKTQLEAERVTILTGHVTVNPTKDQRRAFPTHPQL